MRFDREKLEALAALPDEKLWAEVVRIADMYGYSLPKETPSHTDLEKMRGAVRSDKINVSEALKLVNQYKKK
jgi:hypothetical protein